MTTAELIIFFRKTRPVMIDSEDPYTKGQEAGRVRQWEHMTRELAKDINENILLFMELCE
jgi:hypothetical protein